MSGPGFGYVGAGYAVTAVVLVGYTARLLVRARRVRLALSEERSWR